jgi:flavin-dependent dehydrogenase
MDESFQVDTSSTVQIEAEVVIGAYGKRTRLDKQLERDFMKKESPYVGVKYHIKGDFAKDLISLHNFKNGYCGMSAIEDDKYCLCYLTERSNLKAFGNIPDMEGGILSRNPHLKAIFNHAEFLYEKPEVINEISFAPKKAVENHILMTGDSAGLITPLCGNGMAMAIRGGWMVAKEVERYFSEHHSRIALEKAYSAAWRDEFALRLQIGRNVQRLFGREVLSEIALAFFKVTPPILKMVIKGTHGKAMSSTSITLSK